MIEKQVEAMNEMKKIMTNLSDNVKETNKLIDEVFNPLKKVLTRFKGNKLYDVFNSSIIMSDAIENIIRKLDGFDNITKNLKKMMNEVSSAEDIEIQLNQLQPLLNLDIDSKSFDELSEKANYFYTEIMEDRFEEGFLEEFEDFKDEMFDWFENMDENFEDVFDQEDNIEKMGKDFNGNMNQMKDNLKDMGADLKESFENMEIGNLSDIVEITQLEDIRGRLGAEEQIVSLQEARFSFQRQLGATKGEWSEFLDDSLSEFNKLNEEIGYKLDYSEHFVPSIDEAVETDVSDVEILSDMVEFAYKNRSMLDDVDLEGWTFIREVLQEWEDGDEALQNITDFMGYLDKEIKLDYSATESMGTIDKFHTQIKKLSDGSVEDYQRMSKEIVGVEAVLSDMHADAEPVLDDFYSLLTGEYINDDELIARWTNFTDMSLEQVQKRLEKGDFIGVFEKYMLGFEETYGQLEDREQKTAFREAFGLEDVDDMERFIDYLDDMGDKLDGVSESFDEAEGYGAEFLKLAEPQTFVGRMRNRLLDVDAVEESVLLWQESGMSLEDLAYATIFIRGLFGAGSAIGGLGSKLGLGAKLGGLGAKVGAGSAVGGGGLLGGAGAGGLLGGAGAGGLLGGTVASAGVGSTLGIILLSLLAGGGLGASLSVLLDPQIESYSEWWEKFKGGFGVIKQSIKNLRLEWDIMINEFKLSWMKMDNPVKDFFDGVFDFIDDTKGKFGELVNYIDTFGGRRDKKEPEEKLKPEGKQAWISKLPFFHKGGVVPNLGSEVLSILEPGELIIPNNVIREGLASSISYITGNLGNKASTSTNINKNSEISDTGGKSVIEVMNNNDELINVLEWQTKKIVKAVENISGGEKKDKRMGENKSRLYGMY